MKSDLSSKISIRTLIECVLDESGGIKSIQLEPPRFFYIQQCITTCHDYPSLGYEVYLYLRSLEFKPWAFPSLYQLCPKHNSFTLSLTTGLTIGLYLTGCNSRFTTPLSCPPPYHHVNQPTPTSPLHQK